MLLRWWPRLMAVLSELLVLMNGDGTGGGGALWNLGEKQCNIWFRIPPIFCSFAASSGCGARGWWSRNSDILDPVSSRSAAAGQYSLLELQTIHRFSQSRRRPLLGTSPGWDTIKTHAEHYVSTQPGKCSSRGLISECEILAKVRLKL